VIDESHNFRNNPQVKDRVTRYARLMDEVFRSGVRTKVLMLSATPVNTRLADLKNQVLFATEGEDQALADDGIKSIEATLNRAPDAGAGAPGPVRSILALTCTSTAQVHHRSKAGTSSIPARDRNGIPPGSRG
jgi:hypothetical protein